MKADTYIKEYEKLTGQMVYMHGYRKGGAA